MLIFFNLFLIVSLISCKNIENIKNEKDMNFLATSIDIMDNGNVTTLAENTNTESKSFEDLDISILSASIVKVEIDKEKLKNISEGELKNLEEVQYGYLFDVEIKNNSSEKVFLEEVPCKLYTSKEELKSSLLFDNSLSTEIPKEGKVNSKIFIQSLEASNIEAIEFNINGKGIKIDFFVSL